MYPQRFGRFLNGLKLFPGGIIHDNLTQRLAQTGSVRMSNIPGMGSPFEVVRAIIRLVTVQVVDDLEPRFSIDKSLRDQSVDEPSSCTTFHLKPYCHVPTPVFPWSQHFARSAVSHPPTIADFIHIGVLYGRFPDFHDAKFEPAAANSPQWS